METLKAQKGNLLGYIYWMATWIVLKPLLKTFCHFEVKGTENLENLEKPFIFAMATHSNRLDPWTVSAAVPYHLNKKLVPIRYMTYYKYIEMPVVGQLIKGFKAYPVMPGQGLEKSLESSIEMLGNKEAIGIFPEGGLSKDGSMREGKVGIAYLLAKTNIPVIPVYIEGSFGLNPLTMLSFSKRIKVNFGKPLYKSDIFEQEDVTMTDPNELQSATKLLMGEISSLSKL